ncbi:MAG TPA: DUF4398 domain-containing protein [Candidatus Udaeobacter sp.]|nr:DUF4398 domain-containing protein [Candidatus Udaeobacter sp.]
MSTIFHAHPGAMPRRPAGYRAWLIPSVIIWSVFATSGCTTGEPPTSTLIRAELGLRAAGEARAPEFAPMDLQRAREKLEGSKRAMAAKNYEEARRLAESAQVEAELAEVKAEAEITRRAAEELRRSIDALRVETERRSPKPSSAGSAKE